MTGAADGRAWHPVVVHRALVLVLLAALLLVAAAAPASADPVQQFGVQLKNVRPDGRFTVVFSLNSFDTTGAPPPEIARTTLRVPRGVAIRPSFLRRDRLCDTLRLKTILLNNENDRRGGGDYFGLLNDLARTEKRIGPKLRRGDRRMLHTCRRAFLGRGRLLMDGRGAFADPLPGYVWVFLAKPRKPGSIAGFGMLGQTDQESKVIQRSPFLLQQKPRLFADIYNDPTPDGRYGYRLTLPRFKVSLLSFSVAELRLVVTGATQDGRFWAQLPPRCPANGNLEFRADYRYVGGKRQRTTVAMPCPRYRF